MDILSPNSPENKPHYVYSLAYPDGRVFYVGKGSYNRIKDHERQARGGNTSRKCQIIREIWEEGGQVLSAKLANFGTHEQACMYERALIFFMYGLVNIHPGSPGPHDMDEEARLMRSLAMQGRTISEETRRKISQSHTGMKYSEETRRKMAEANKGKGKTFEQGRKPTSDETRHKLSIAKLGKKRGPRSEEERRKISAGSKGKPGTPWTEERRRNFVEKRTGHSVSEETRQKIGNANRRMKVRGK